jgi:acetyl esterase/lipase
VRHVVGSAPTEARRVAHWVRAGYVVVAPEYRSAPEPRLPVYRVVSASVYASSSFSV